MKLPPDWEAESGGYSRHLIHLIHTPCGFRTGMVYDLNGLGSFGESDARMVVYNHQCATDD